MSMHRMSDVLARGMLDVVEELRMRLVDGEVVSMLLITELAGERRPVTVVRGRFERDNYSALTALARAEHAVHQRMDGSGFEDLR